MGKQKKRNAFYYFMVEKKPEVEKRLKRPVALAEVAPLVTAEWHALPEAQRKKYQMMSGNKREKLDCRGVPLRQLEEEAQDRRRQAEEMKRDIAELVDMYHLGGALHQATFFLVSTNYYAHTDQDYYVPAELGLLRFSLKNGIMREFHGIVTPHVPRSYAASARKHSQDTHKLLQDSEDYASSIEEMASSLKQFLSKEWDKDVPVYTLHEDLEQTRQIMSSVTGEDFKIYSLDMLYQFIYSAAVRFIPLSIATDMITECGLDYFPNMACMLHNTDLKDGARFCALSCVRRWVYFMCQHLDLKKLFGVVPQEGKHYPMDELRTDVSDSLSSLTLEDSNKAHGAVGYDPWIGVDGKGQGLSTRPWEEEYPPLGEGQPKKGPKAEDAISGRQARTSGEGWSRPTLQMD